MVIYIMRHGETVWNRKGIVQGRSKNRLSQCGKEQVAHQSESLKNIKLDAIFSSPLFRTIQSANIINKYHNLKIIRDDRLIEIDQGIFTGRVKSTLTEEEKKIKDSKPAGYGLETYDEIIARASDFISFLKANYRDKMVLVVTHRCIAKTLYSLLTCSKTLKNDITYDKIFNNAEIKKVEIN